MEACYHDIGKKDKAQVNVEHPRPRRIGQGLLEDCLDSLMAPGCGAGGRMARRAIREQRLIQRGPCREATGVCEQLAHGGRAERGPTCLRVEVLQGVIEMADTLMMRQQE